MTVPRWRMTMQSRIQSGELDQLWEPAPEDLDPDKNPIVLLHGSGVNNYNMFVQGSRYACSFLGPMGALSGRKVIAGWFGNQSFANDTLVSRVNASLTLVGGTKFHVFGVSMGGGGAVRYGSVESAKTASVMGITPMADINAIYQANRLGLRADIGTAWGVTYPTALPAQSNLPGVHGPVLAANNTPRRLLYSTADTSVLPSEVTALATSMDITAEIVSTTDNHTEVSAYNAMNLDAEYPWADYIKWIDGIDAA